MARFRILEEFGLEDRLVYTYSEVVTKIKKLLKPVDWNEVNKKLEKLKNNSLSILKEALSPIKKFPSDYDILYEALLAEKKRVNQLAEEVKTLLIQKNEVMKEDKLPKTSQKIGKNKIKLPKFLGRLVCCFIPKKKNRKRFRKNHIK